MKLLRDNSGVSLMFVMAVTFMLLAIGVSALTAATLNFGTHLNQRERDMIKLYASSMEQTIKASLDDIDADDSVSINDADSLGEYILKKSFEGENSWTIKAYAPDYDEDNDRGVSYIITINAYNNDPYSFLSSEEGLRIDIIQQWQYFPAYCIDCDNMLCPGGDECMCTGCVKAPADRIPLKTGVSGYLTVRIETFNTAGPEPTVPRSVTVTTYQYSGGMIQEKEDLPAYDSEPSLDNMYIAARGQWKVIRYETIGQ